MSRLTITRRKSFISLLILPLLFSCARDFSPTAESQLVYRVSLAVEDPQGKRKGNYELVAHHSRYDFLLECSFDRPCWKEVADAKDLPLNEAWQKLTTWEFDRYDYDLIVLAVPDPSHFARLLGNSWKDGKRLLEFGVYRNENAGAVPMVVVAENFLFRY